MLKVRTLNVTKTNIIEKGIGILLLEHQFIRAIRHYWSDVHFDLVLYATPPITFNKVIQWQKKQGAHTYLMLKDIFPQNAVDLGMMKQGSFIWKIFRDKEKQLYAISDRIGCMSPANCRYVVSHKDVDANKVELCPNAVDKAFIAKPLSSEEKTSIRARYGLPSDIPLFIYGGNLGKPQGVDFIIEVLDAVKNRGDVEFLVVGAGTEAHKLKKWQQEQEPTNIHVFDLLPKQDYDKLVAAADVGLIFLDKRFTIPNYPSRLLSYLENKLPILLATDVNTDMGRIAEAEGFGIWSESGDTNAILNNIDKLVGDLKLRADMGDKGYRYLMANYTVDRVADIILRPFSDTNL